MMDDEPATWEHDFKPFLLTIFYGGVFMLALKGLADIMTPVFWDLVRVAGC